MTLDLKDHFLQSTLPEADYIRVRGKYFFEDIRAKYDIESLVASDGFVYCKLKRGMYGLKQAAKLARDKLIEHLAAYIYATDPAAPNLWTHESRRTKFCLCVDDFGVKYFNEDDAQHLISALRDAYDIMVDKTGSNYCGLSIAWKYGKGYADISMP